MNDEAGGRPVVDGADPDGPVAAGQPGAGPAAVTDAPVSGDADPGASHAEPDAARMAGEDAPKAPNQAKTEPVPPSGAGDLPGAADRPDPAGGLPGGDLPGGGGDLPSGDLPGRGGDLPRAAGRPDPAGDLAGAAGRADGDLAGAAGELPDPAGGAPGAHAGTVTGPGPREGWASAPPSSEPSGDVQGVPVPSTVPAEGTSQRSAPVEGVTFPAVAPEGLADGETDVAMPSTTHF